MRKMKKFLAMFLAMAMVLGMSVTAFAAETATLHVTDADNATFKMLQVIKADPSTVTGWAFTSPEAEGAYTNAFGTVVEGEMPAIVSDQDAIVMLILAGGVPEDDLPVAYQGTGLKAATAAQIGRALSNVYASLSAQFVPMKNPETVTSAGIYAVKGEEEGYTYNNMAIYVGFGPVSGENYPELTSEPIAAKKSPTTTEKTVEDTDKVVAIGDVVTYTIKAKVPFIDPNNTDKTFTITDEIKGATYYFPTSETEMDNGSWDDSIASVRMDEGNGEASVVGSAELFKVKDNGTGFTITLDQLINDANSNAGKEITVTYTVKVTETTVENTAQGHAGGSDFGSSTPVKVYSGQITLTKYGKETTQSDGTTAPEKLAGAGFEIYAATLGADGSVTPTGEALKFVPTFKIIHDETDGTTAAVAVDGSYTYAPDAKDGEYITEVFTGEGGTLVIEGLNLGTYHFEETTAPQGYSINTDGTNATLTLAQGTTEATATVTATTDITDTTLNALPSTGGIGTTIFTIGGCVIMVAAAGLFFATRKKSSEK